MSANLRKFANAKFIKTIDLALMRRLMERYEDEKSKTMVTLLDRPDADARAALTELLAGPEDQYPEGLRADLHRASELGSRSGLNILIEEAHRRRIDLFPELKAADKAGANPKHDPKHIAVRAFLEHPNLFNAASDQMVLRSAERFSGFRGTKGNITADLSDERREKLRQAIGHIFKEAYQGDHCRLGVHFDAGEINIVVTHGSVVSTLPVLEGKKERVICIRSVSHALLRYSETEGLLRMASFKKSLRQDIADLFAMIVLDRPAFFRSESAQDLYSLRRVERLGAAFAFKHGWEPEIDRVVILSATATLRGSGSGRAVSPRSMMASDPRGGAVGLLLEAPVRFDGGWQLSELQFRVFFKGSGGRKSQATVTLRPPSVLHYRSAEHEQRILDLIARNGLTNDRDDFQVLAAAE